MYAPPRRHGPINWMGLRTLCRKEVMRFLDVYPQTVVGPVVTGLLFLAVFALALGEGREIAGVPAATFLAPGLIAMTLAQSAFANASSSLVVAKIQGNIVDVLMPPLGAIELTVGYLAGGIVRGLICGAALGLAMLPIVDLGIADPLLLALHAVAGAAMLALIGIVTGIVAEKFDHSAFVTNFIVTPLAFLSGTFYSIDRLPHPLADLAHANPFFHMIDGIRGAIIGVSDGHPWQGLAIVAAVDVVLTAAVLTMFARGIRLKA